MKSMTSPETEQRASEAIIEEVSVRDVIELLRMQYDRANAKRAAA